jgi:protein gp37
MSDKTGIFYADAVWNPTCGCTAISPACHNCWAESMARRLVGSGVYPKTIIAGSRWSGKTAERHRALAEPLSWQSQKTIAVNFMGDLFHKDTPNYVIRKVFYTMWQCRDRHTFLILTKRPFRMRKWIDDYLDNQIENTEPWPWSHVWLGTSVENNSAARRRIPDLLQTPASIRFVSFEPLLEEIMRVEDWLCCTPRIDWAIIGCDSRNGRPGRYCCDSWIDDIMNDCLFYSVPVFLKQAVIHNQLVDLPLWRGHHWYQFPETIPLTTIEKCEKFIRERVGEAA